MLPSEAATPGVHIAWKSFSAHDSSFSIRHGLRGGSVDDSTHRRSWKQTMAALRAAYSASDIRALRRAVSIGRHGDSRSRLTFGAIETVYPLSPLLKIAEELDERIADDGLHNACRDVMHKHVDCTSRIHPRAAEVVSNEAIIFYGNHPSMLTPFLMAASVDRDDLRFVSTEYVRHLIPQLRDYSYPVELSLTAMGKQIRRGGLKRWMVGLLLSLLHHVPPREQSKAINRESLQAAADHVRDGGSVLICPDGGGKRLSRWYPGLGVLIKAAMRSPRPVYLIPIHERHSSNHRIVSTLLNGPISRFKRRFVYRRRIVVELAQPIRLDRAEVSEKTPVELTLLLRLRYAAQFKGAR